MRNVLRGEKLTEHQCPECNGQMILTQGMNADLTPAKRWLICRLCDKKSEWDARNQKPKE